MGIFDIFRKKKSAYLLIKEKLESELATAEFSNDWKLCQDINLKLLWLNLVKKEDELWEMAIPPQFRDKASHTSVETLAAKEIAFPI